MTKSGVLSSILARIKISTDDLKKYGVDLEQVSSIRYLRDYLTVSLPGKINFVKRQVPLLGVNSDYFDTCLEGLKGSNIRYKLCETPYRHIILKKAKFKIRDDCSYADSLKSERMPLGLDTLIML